MDILYNNPNQVRRPSGGDSRGPALPKPRRAQKLDEEPLYDKVGAFDHQESLYGSNIFTRICSKVAADEEQEDEYDNHLLYGKVRK